MNMKGVHCQMSPIMTAARAPYASFAHEVFAKPSMFQIG